MKRKTKVWEKILIAIGVMVGVVAVTNIYDMMHSLFTGIQISENGELEVKSHKKIPTEEQLEILYNSGSWASDIKDMKENGMDSVTQAYVETAQIMMDHLEEKYGIPFMACGGDGGPGLLGSGGYENFMYALEGEYAYQKFETKYGVDAKGKKYYVDKYYLLTHTMEFQEELQKMVDDAGLDIKIIVWLDGYIGHMDEQGKEFSEVCRENNLDVDIHGYTKKELSEDEFYRQSQQLIPLFKTTNIRMEVTTRRLLYDCDFEQVNSGQDELDFILSKTMDEEKWDLSYDGYITVESRGAYE